MRLSRILELVALMVWAEISLAQVPAVRVCIAQITRDNVYRDLSQPVARELATRTAKSGAAINSVRLTAKDKKELSKRAASERCDYLVTLKLAAPQNVQVAPFPDPPIGLDQSSPYSQPLSREPAGRETSGVRVFRFEVRRCRDSRRMGRGSLQAVRSGRNREAPIRGLADEIARRIAR